MNNQLSGVINIYKEKGYTSHDVVAVVRGILGRVKAGHTGTLDPAAEGVLPVCIGKATKIAEYLASETKGYRAVMHLGIITDTDDTTGTILRKTEVTASEEEINQAILSFKKEYWQTPPMYSAIKMNGKKLYELAREGKMVERKQRKVNIFDIQIRQFMPGNCVEMDILCSKGTYIRSLCLDIGNALGCGGTMGNLLRTSSGRFKVEDSIKLSTLKEILVDGKLHQVLLPIGYAMPDIQKVTVREFGEKYLYNGNKISANYMQGHGSDLQDGQMVFVYSAKKELAGLYLFLVETKGDTESRFLKPITMLL